MKKNKTKTLISQIVDSIQNKKGKKIIVADLTAINDTITNYLIICEGYSSSQVNSLVENIRDEVKQKTGESVLSIDGKRNAEWVAMDYADVVVHVFQPESRIYYNLENLWADAQLTSIPDID